MAFDWETFLTSYGVPYVTRGPNVSRGHVSVKCPFCGNDDPSQHLTISLAGNGWYCYRNRDHRGKNPARLIQHLINVTSEQARAIAGQSILIPDDFMGAVLGKLAPPEVPLNKGIKLPREFKPLDPSRHSAKRFVRYLEDRGFSEYEIERMHDRHGLCYATQGSFRGRIIFPIWKDGKLQTYTGRTVYPDVDLRYKTLSQDPEKEESPATGPISDFLLWHDDIADGGECLVLVEGPFDALKVRTLGRAYGVRATCCFTAQPSPMQIEALHDIAPRYKRRVLLLDRGTLATTLRTESGLAGLGFRSVFLPERYKDPGELQRPRDLMGVLPR